jgi:SAM-dependent methyltransferase
MAERRDGLHGLLEHSAMYAAFKRLTSRNDRWGPFVREYIRPRPGDRILDLGCGVADVLRALPPVDYLGIDANPGYIHAAGRRHGRRGRFVCARIGEAPVDTPASWDLVLGLGVLHHLEDDEALAFLGLAARALRPGGRLVTHDGCFVAGQSRLARLLLSWDRGRNVRTAEGYLTLAKRIFREVTLHVRHDMLRIPYSLAILECRAKMAL